jgi:CRISPR-associated endonuclease/helicase Cas3
MTKEIECYWGKARPCSEGGLRWHPLAWHMLDVAACAKSILEARPGARRVIAKLLALDEAQAISLATLLAALHDLGKLAAPFQQKAEGPLWPFEKARDDNFGRSEHDRDGLSLWHDQIAGAFGDRIWPGAAAALNALMAASVGHHGRAVGAGNCRVDELFRAEGVGAALALTQSLIDLLLPMPISAPPPDEARLGPASFWFAGFVTIADWAGSTQTYFPYSRPDREITAYWRCAERQALTAIHGLGLAPAPASALQTFSALTGNATLSPLQGAAETMNLPDGPVLVVIEDVTGAGKTEAAQILVNRLMSAGRASGAYWAMPTQATANAMYARQRDAIAALFAEGSRPQLTLAHGGARLHEAFQSSVVRSRELDLSNAGHDEIEYGDKEPDETASAACSAFLADDARAALLADVGAGTIDQAILGVLPARFQAVRLFGLSDKVLIIDEAHAYDAYLGEELEGLLKFHAALGGSAIVLSATLPRDVERKSGREQIVRAWMEGCGVRMRDLRGKKVVQCDAYPLVTTVSHAGVTETFAEAADWSRRTVPVRFVTSEDEILAALVAAARAGAAVAWVRNTVDDALNAAGLVRGRGLAPIVFHARFAQCDRQRIESEVMARLGPRVDASARRETIIIATQVIEQSLDLDFDLMASDLAPIDLLIQRAGRLRRHGHRDAARPDVAFELIVNAPEFEGEPKADWLSRTMPGTEAVYKDPVVLWRSMRALMSQNNKITTPDGLRGLIEAVYGERGDPPPGLLAKTLKAEGAAMGEGGQARQSLLSLGDGYSAAQVAWVSEEHPRVRTRLGDDQTTLRLARIGADGALCPWAEGDGALWRRWALSEVKVSAWRAPVGCKPQSEFTAAAAAARTQWGKREQKRDDLIILALKPDGEQWRGALVDSNGAPRHFAYDEVSGLRFVGPG